uniref:flavonol sulfotransferase-like n=1 Tax=Erigeron canadensis TaxID=72917 RepID=UPI001CB8D2B1|nr:flavonol sulfotransferase-like [Erigeron canadensis]
MSIPTTSHAFPDLSFVTEDDPKVERANLSLILDRYKDRFKDLPKVEKGWLSKSMNLYQGHWYSSSGVISIGTVLASQDAFQAHPSDLYLATPPKCGTTWLKALVFAIVNRTKYKNNSNPLLVSNPHDCLPFIENEILRNKPTYNVDSQPRLFATHMSYLALPQSVLDSGCSLVYMCRNPKDVLVSTFHFVNKVRDKSLGVMTIEEAFELFSKGFTPCGPFWDHVKEYYKASLDHPEKILFLTYENLQKDTISNVKRIAEFLGYPFTKEEEVEGVVEEIVSLCSFENLREHNQQGIKRDGLPNDAFFRKGKVGDWSNYLTNDMSQILDQITEEKFLGLDISF